jgi:hypothetical protein
LAVHPGHRIAWATSVTQARDLLTDAPDLADRVADCTLSLAGATVELGERRREARQRERDAEMVAWYKEAISKGEMTFEEALARAREEIRQERERVAAEADARRHWLEEFGNPWPGASASSATATTTIWPGTPSPAPRACSSTASPTDGACAAFPVRTASFSGRTRCRDSGNVFHR